MDSPRRASLIWRAVLAAEGIVLIGLGAATLIVLAFTAGLSPSQEAQPTFFPFNSAHGALLLAVGCVTILMARWHKSLITWSAVLCVGFVVLFLYGTAQSTADQSSTWLWLDPAENFLHAGIAVVNFIVLSGAAAVPWWRKQRERS